MRSPCAWWKSVPPSGQSIRSRPRCGRWSVSALGPSSRRAERVENRVAEEDQPPARPQQPVRVRDPDVRVAPDGGAVLREDEVERGVRQRRVLGARVDQRELEPVLLLELARGGQLVLRDVEADRPCAQPHEPRAPVAGAAAEVDHVEPAHVRQDAHLLLGHLPAAPPWRVAGPALARVLDPVRGVLVPLLAVAGGVL